MSMQLAFKRIPYNGIFISLANKQKLCTFQTEPFLSKHRLPNQSMRYVSTTARSFGVSITSLCSLLIQIPYIAWVFPRMAATPMFSMHSASLMAQQYGIYKWADQDHSLDI